MRDSLLKIIREKGEDLKNEWNTTFLDRDEYWNKGPSKFFYDEILNWHKNKSLESLLSERAFLKDVYAVLTAWGLNRLGLKGPKMKDFEDFKKAILEKKDQIITLSNYALPCDLSPIKDSIKDLFTYLKLMISSKILVANSKTLHLLIPPYILL